MKNLMGIEFAFENNTSRVPSSYNRSVFRAGELDLHYTGPNSVRINKAREEMLSYRDDYEDELYLMRKRNKIKTQYGQLSTPGPKLSMRGKKEQTNLSLTRKINSVIENFKLRKESLPQLVPTKVSDPNLSRNIGKNNRPTVMKKKAGGMSIFVFKEPKEPLDKSLSFEEEPPKVDKFLLKKSGIIRQTSRASSNVNSQASLNNIDSIKLQSPRTARLASKVLNI